MLETWPSWYILIAAAGLGLIIGSFLNVLSLRLPRQLVTLQQAEPPSSASTRKRWFGLDYLIWPPSQCGCCQRALRPWHMIPVISWVWLRARCAYCAARISVRYPVMEVGTALATICVVLQFGSGLTALYASCLVWGLITLSAIDSVEYILPDQLTLPLLWLGLIANLTGAFVPLADAVWGAISGYVSLWCVFHIFHLITGKEGLGYGDFKLYAALGAWLGWELLPQILLLASLTGALVGVGLIMMGKRDRQAPLPFGPFLAGAGGIALFYGAEINQWYLGVMGL